MPTIKFTDNTPEGIAREAQINQVLPKEPIHIIDIDDELVKDKQKALVQALTKEIEIYKAFPKKGEYQPDNFNPRNSRACFMGQGFTSNGSGFEGWTDYDLKRYRQAVGTIHHETWGNVTLLEIWGGDHFKDHEKMVKDVFLYCWGDLDKLPKIKFYINPFYANDKSGQWDPHEDEIYQEAHRKHILKIGNYMEIRDRMRRAKVKNPMELGIYEKDDPNYKESKKKS